MGQTATARRRTGRNEEHEPPQGDKSPRQEMAQSLALIPCMLSSGIQERSRRIFVLCWYSARTQVEPHRTGMPEVRWCIHESIPRAYLDFSYPGYISAQVVPYSTISVSLLACVTPRTKPLDTCSGHDALMWKPRRQGPRHLFAAHLICRFVVDKLEARNVFTTCVSQTSDPAHVARVA